MAWRDEFLPASLREFMGALAAITMFGLLMGIVLAAWLR